ncbi:MAG: DUF4105 domain-containing protein [Candidatus Symbiothrix sp.]|jgi:hypothetical protein|nr:DUF4105 domain-containing protein [Candidatus Symbiothrix sp.]
MKRFILFFLLLSALLPVRAWETDSLQVSLLTVMPRPNEVYTIYGHTALRIQDPVQKIDAVFNWGTFDFNTPHFLYRFVKGETDYFLSVSDYDRFIYVYSLGNADIVEQLLAVSPEGKTEIMNRLSTNLQPENLIYRYNFLFDNCTTRIRDLIEQGSDGRLVYPEQTEIVTFRDLIHSCTNPYPWMTFGIDLLIGSGADSLISVRQELFLPEKLMNAVDKSPLIIASNQVLTSLPEPVSEQRFWDSPLKIGFLILLIYITLAAAGIVSRIKRSKPFSIFHFPFSILFLIAGLAGCIVAFTTLFSYHPCTSPNWNLLWLHPFHLIAFVGYLFKKSYRFISWYHAVNLVLLSVLLLGGYWIPQQLNPANIPFILCLGLASGCYWVYGARGKGCTTKNGRLI